MRAVTGASIPLCGLVALAGCDQLGQLPTAFSMLPQSGYEIVAPANLPPAGYTGEFWVDRNGCEFIKTTRGGWIPRFGNDGKAFCNDDLRGVTGTAPRGTRTPASAAQRGPLPGQIVERDTTTGAVTRVAAPNVIPPSYVNVATFNRTANGIAARKAFSDLGYPIVGAGTQPAPGRAVSVVLGPFTVQDALDDALNMARALGYEGATTYSN